MPPRYAEERSPRLSGSDHSRLHCCDTEVGRSGDGVLVGAQKEKNPLVRIGLMFDFPGNLFPSEPLRSVLQAVGQNGNNDLPRSVFLGQCSEALAEVVDGLADSVEQSG